MGVSQDERRVPIFLVIGSDRNKRDRVAGALEHRFTADYEVLRADSGGEAIVTAGDLAVAGRRVALVFSSLSLSDTDGWEAMAATRAIHSGALRILYLEQGDRDEAQRVQLPLQRGLADHYVLLPQLSPDEAFYATVSELLGEWARSSGRQFKLADVVGEPLSQRVHQLRDLAARNRVPVEVHDIHGETGRRILEDAGVDDAELPVMILWDGRTLRNPSDMQITDAFTGGDTPDWTTFDVAVIGGGPAGLATGVSAASEGLQSFILERTAMGGQAGTTSRIRNYLGFPRGISGQELAQRAFDQAWTFSVAFQFARSAEALLKISQGFVTRLSDGVEVRSRFVVLAPGVDYRRLEVPELERLVGSGVYYGAAVTEAESTRNRDVFIVGGGNSAGQAAVHLSRFARTVTMVVRGSNLAASMSDYLVRQIEVNDNIAFRFNSQVVGGGGARELEFLELRHDGGETHRYAAGGLFVLIGAAPRTNWLPPELLRDEWGYILTGSDIAPDEEWPLERGPLPYETSVPGVFAVGDVRHGSVKRVASAVGEGSVVIQSVHAFLADEEANARPATPRAATPRSGGLGPVRPLG
jgi:thioredoxin reductase (NADPH)